MSQTPPPKWFTDAMAVPLQRRTLTVAAVPAQLLRVGRSAQAADRPGARRRRARDVVESACPAAFTALLRRRAGLERARRQRPARNLSIGRLGRRGAGHRERCRLRRAAHPGRPQHGRTGEHRGRGAARSSARRSRHRRLAGETARPREWGSRQRKVVPASEDLSRSRDGARALPPDPRATVRKRVHGRPHRRVTRCTRPRPAGRGNSIPGCSCAFLRERCTTTSRACAAASR